MKGKDKLKNSMLSIARIIFGATFVFSGFVKAVDPIGFVYKIEDYLISFHLLELIPLALTFAVLLILLEFLLGVFILLGFYRKPITILSLLLMVGMTSMTLYIALANPVEDCGCFGDALVISNWGTFYKNIVLLFFIIVLYVNHHKIVPLISAKKSKYLVTGCVCLFSLLFCFYNILYLPVIDFRPYKVGVNISKQMEEDLNNADVYENIYIYEKNGVEKEFTEDNFPWEDSTWTFVDYKSILIEKGEKAQIEEFHIIAYNKDDTGEFVASNDITDEVLAKPITLFVVSLSLDNAREKAMQQIVSTAETVADKNIDLLIATSSGAKTLEEWHKKWGNSSVRYAQMDELTLKTIVRSNPGLLLLNKGTIQGKWSSRNLPSASKLNEIIAKLKSGEKVSSTTI